MDTNEWVFLSDDDGFFDIIEDGDENQIFSGKRNSCSKCVVENYFTTSPKSRNISELEASRNFHQKQVVHVPILLEPRIEKVQDEGLLVEEKNILFTSPPTTITEKTKGDFVEPDQDTVSQVFFKIKEMESPKSCGRGILYPSLDVGALRFEDKGEAQEIMTSPRMKIEKEVVIVDCDSNKVVEDTSGGFNFWKWSFNGVGAICSFGVAAATICVLLFGSQQRNKIHQDHKIRFQIYTDDKRIKQVVQHATKLSEAISVVNGVHLSRARITCGGYYDGL
ncbi:hypothetical protein RJT34_21619 [Clitoria ternatea]|uniref:DUF6821 domain-containing protein n=1 Tax=Clitoria ternatea TaxID=43366 RepID=A0AAN9P5X7_CLITE